jgi:ABC-type multidrug transport system ATPase subunit
VLLDGVSGYAEPGKLTTLMGASGAGKTTLLDVLAGRESSGEIKGRILLNGRAPTPDDFASITGYVEQFDSLMAFDTVRETLQFAARKLSLGAKTISAVRPLLAYYVALHDVPIGVDFSHLSGCGFRADSGGKVR